MKLRDIIKLSCVMLSLEEVLQSRELYDENFDILDEMQVNTAGTSLEKTFNLLINCFNNAYQEIATDYFPLITMEKITVVNGCYNLSNLSNNFYKLVKIEDNYGQSVDAKIYDNFIYIKNGEYNVVYCYTPNKITLNGSINNFNGRLVDRVFAYALNKEYCFVSGLYSEAESYKTKFEEAIKMAKSNKKEIKLPKRRWA